MRTVSEWKKVMSIIWPFCARTVYTHIRNAAMQAAEEESRREEKILIDWQSVGPNPTGKLPLSEDQVRNREARQCAPIPTTPWSIGRESQTAKTEYQSPLHVERHVLIVGNPISR